VPLNGRRRYLWWSAAGIATAATLLLGVFTWPKENGRVDAPAQQYATHKGERANLMLADGTHVVLGVMSSLQYTPRTRTGERRVRLVGEAYFEVMHDPATPFVVETGTSVTRVLGTSFSVRRYPGDSAVRVVVASGKVALDRTPVSAGEVGVRGASGVSVRRDVRTAPLLAWTTGRLVFDGASLADVLTELSRWYDVTFRVDDPALARTTLTATFTHGTVNDIADAIATTLGARYERRGNEITFHVRTHDVR
jgi:ferric-dicitrate binding protein FerR (iron transport regulator)